MCSHKNGIYCNLIKIERKNKSLKDVNCWKTKTSGPRVQRCRTTNHATCNQTIQTVYRSTRILASWPGLLIADIAVCSLTERTSCRCSCRTVGITCNSNKVNSNELKLANCALHTHTHPLLHEYVTRHIRTSKRCQL